MRFVLKVVALALALYINWPGATLAQRPALRQPGGVAANVTTGRFYVVNEEGANVTVFDDKDRVVATIPVGYKPRYVAVDSVLNKVYVTRYFCRCVSVIDGQTNRQVTEIPLEGNPLAVAVHPLTSRVFVATIADRSQQGTFNGMVVIDGGSNRVAGSVALSAAPGGLAIHPRNNWVYLTNPGANSMSILDGVGLRLLATVLLKSVSDDIEINAEAGVGYAADPRSNAVTVFDATQALSAVIGSIAVGNSPASLALDRVANRLYVANASDRTISVIDGASRRVVQTIKLAGTRGIIAANAGIDVAPGIRRGFVTHQQEEFVSSFDLAALAAVATPAMNPATGQFVDTTTVVLTTATPGAEIRYTTTGSVPTDASPLYSGGLVLKATTTLKAKAFKQGLAPSAVVTGLFTRLEPVATPAIGPASGTFAGSTTITIGSPTPQAQLRYTRDGSTPNETSSLYTAPFALTATTTVRVKGYKTGMAPSAVASATFSRLDPVTMPILNPATGTFTWTTTVTAVTATPGATLRYTTNGADPTEASALYTRPLALASTTTLKVRGFKAGMLPSTVAAATYSRLAVPVGSEALKAPSASAALCAKTVAPAAIAAVPWTPTAGIKYAPAFKLTPQLRVSPDKRDLGTSVHVTASFLEQDSRIVGVNYCWRAPSGALVASTFSARAPGVNSVVQGLTAGGSSVGSRGAGTWNVTAAWVDANAIVDHVESINFGISPGPGVVNLAIQIDGALGLDILAVKQPGDDPQSTDNGKRLDCTKYLWRNPGGVCELSFFVGSVLHLRPESANSSPFDRWGAIGNSPECDSVDVKNVCTITITRGTTLKANFGFKISKKINQRF